MSNVIPFYKQRMWDTFVNLLAGLGVTGRDKFASQTYTFTPLNRVELDMAFRGDWIARKVVQIPADDMTRQWRNWQAEGDQIEAIEEVEKNLCVQSRLQEALIKSRLYGGAAIIIGVDVGQPEEELDVEQVTQDSLQFLHVVAQHEINAGPLISDLLDPFYGRPEFYEARSTPSTNGRATAISDVRIHPSRVVRLVGLPLTDRLTEASNNWGDSVLQPVNDAVKSCGLVSGSLATLISELKVDVVKIPDLAEALSTPEGTSKLTNRFAAANVAKSVINTILLDKDEEWQRVEANLSGVPDVLMSYLQIASAAADIPATRFLGRSPAGLNATGDSDTRNYYDRLKSEQTSTLTPAMSVLDEVIIRSALGDRDEDIFYNWASLWQQTEAEKADVAYKKGQTFKIDADAGIIPTTALAHARVNQLIEDGTYPGLEQAMEDAEAEGDSIEEFNAPPDPSELAPGSVVDPKTGEVKPAPPPALPGQTPPRALPPPRDSKPKRGRHATKHAGDDRKRKADRKQSGKRGRAPRNGR